MRTFELGEVETLLMPKHKIAENEVTAFRGRMRFLRDSGVPDKTPTGSGNRHSYTKRDVWEIHVALKLHDLGLPPRQIVEIIKSLRRDHIYKGSYVVIMFMDTYELRTIALEKRAVGGSIDGWIQLGSPRDFLVIKLDDEIASYI